MKSLLSGIAAFFFISTVMAQVGEDKPDERIKKSLEELLLKYEVNSRNNFKLTYITVPESKDVKERTHLVIVNSKTEQIDGVEVREIYAYAIAYDKTKADDAVVHKLMARNGEVKIGAWCLAESEEESLLYFHVFVSPSISKENLASVMELVANEADRVEKELNPSEDKY